MNIWAPVFYFLSFMRTFNASILFLPLLFIFATTFCVWTYKRHKNKIGFGGESKPSQSKMIGIVEAISFCSSDMDWHHDEKKKTRKKPQNKTLNWIPKYMYWSVSARRHKSQQELKMYCLWTLLFAILYYAESTRGTKQTISE